MQSLRLYSYVGALKMSQTESDGMRSNFIDYGVFVCPSCGRIKTE